MKQAIVTARDTTVGNYRVTSISAVPKSQHHAPTIEIIILVEPPDDYFLVEMQRMDQLHSSIERTLARLQEPRS